MLSYVPLLFKVTSLPTFCNILHVDTQDHQRNPHNFSLHNIINCLGTTLNATTRHWCFLLRKIPFRNVKLDYQIFFSPCNQISGHTTTASVLRSYYYTRNTRHNLTCWRKFIKWHAVLRIALHHTESLQGSLGDIIIHKIIPSLR
jgi:hypothetical protein